jgi:predicted component of type VI protein secretion system
LVEHFHGKEGVVGSSPTPGFVEALLIVRSGLDAGRECPLPATLVIGRSPEADMVLTDPTISRRHVELRMEGTTVVVEDLGSSNGTYVNGGAIEIPTRLGFGDVIRIGSTEMEIAPDTGESPASTPTTPTEIVS